MISPQYGHFNGSFLGGLFYSHVNLSHVELHLSYGDVQPVVEVDVVVLALRVLLFEEEAQASFSLRAPPAGLQAPLASFQLLVQAVAAPGWGGHAGHAVHRVGHGVQIGCGGKRRKLREGSVDTGSAAEKIKDKKNRKEGEDEMQGCRTEVELSGRGRSAITAEWKTG